jgi:hypothetical protein
MRRQSKLELLERHFRLGCGLLTLGFVAFQRDGHCPWIEAKRQLIFNALIGGDQLGQNGVRGLVRLERCTALREGVCHLLTARLDCLIRELEPNARGLAVFSFRLERWPSGVKFG